MNLLKTLAPVAASIIFGPAGPVAAEALAEVAKGLGLVKGSTVDRIEEYLDKNPEQGKEKLTAIEAEFRVKMARLAIKQQAIESQERKDARLAYKENRDAISSAVSISVIVSFLGMIAIVAYFEYHKLHIESQIMLILVGAATSKFGDLVAFYYGSSKPSVNSNGNSNSRNK